MNHLSIETLLSLREPGVEPGTAAAREHLDHCSLCQGEMDRLHQRVARLKALPPLRPGRDRWPETAARYRAERARRRTRMIGAAGLAAAASLALFVSLGPDAQPAVDPTATQLQSAMVRSRALESALSAYGPEERVLDGRTARMAEALEERIARVDRALEATELLPEQGDEELLRLWQERVGLLDALVDVHVTRASNAGL